MEDRLTKATVAFSICKRWAGKNWDYDRTLHTEIVLLIITYGCLVQQSAVDTKVGGTTKLQQNLENDQQKNTTGALKITPIVGLETARTRQRICTFSGRDTVWSCRLHVEEKRFFRIESYETPVSIITKKRDSNFHRMIENMWRGRSQHLLEGLRIRNSNSQASEGGEFQIEIMVMKTAVKLVRYRDTETRMAIYVENQAD